LTRFFDVFEQKVASVESEDEEWTEKFGAEAQRVIRKCVDDNVEHYEYLKKFAIQL
jgi:hypothetical protein